jgi:hypothetical protein
MTPILRACFVVEPDSDDLTMVSGGKGHMKGTWPIDSEVDLDIQIMERPEIVELLFSALIEPNDVEALSQFLSPRVEWILSAADPQTLGEESPPNAIKFSGKQGFRELALY